MDPHEDAHAYSDAASDATDEGPTQDLKILQVIGEGGYGTVYRGIWNGQLIAVKVIEHDERSKTGQSILNDGETFCPYGREDTISKSFSYAQAY
jgi:serine/threonine protein kinase